MRVNQQLATSRTSAARRRREFSGVLIVQKLAKDLDTVMKQVFFPSTADLARGLAG